MKKKDKKEKKDKKQKHTIADMKLNVDELTPEEFMEADLNHDNEISDIEEFIYMTNKAGKKARKKSLAFWTEFKKFVAKGNVIDLAVAVVIGAAFNKIVNTVVSGVITPLTSMLLRSDNFNEMRWILRPAVEAVEGNPELGIEPVKAVSEISVKYGELIQVIIDFMIIALTIFVILRMFMKLKHRIHHRELAAKEAAEKAAAAKKKAEAEAEAARQAEEAEKLDKIKQEYLNNVAIQANMLTEIREIMLRMEQGRAESKENQE